MLPHKSYHPPPPPPQKKEKSINNYDRTNADWDQCKRVQRLRIVTAGRARRIWTVLL